MFDINIVLGILFFKHSQIICTLDWFNNTLYSQIICILDWFNNTLHSQIICTLEWFNNINICRSLVQLTIKCNDYVKLTLIEKLIAKKTKKF